MKLGCSVLFAVLLFACTPAAPPAEQRQTPDPAVTVDDIRGDWRLARLDSRAAADQPADAEIPAEIRLVIGDRTVRATSQCISFAWRYEKAGDRMTLTPANAGAMCARGLTDWESDFDRVMTAVTEVRIVDGALRLAGAGGDLEFLRAQRPASTNLMGEWVLKRLDAIGGADGGPAPDIVVTITGDTLRAQSQCVAYWWRYRQSGEQLEMSAEDPGPVCERTRTEGEKRFERVLNEVSIGILRDSTTLLLDGAAGQAELQRRE